MSSTLVQGHGVPPTLGNIKIFIRGMTLVRYYSAGTGRRQAPANCKVREVSRAPTGSD